MKIEHFSNMIKQIEFGYNFFVGSCASCYETTERQTQAIEEGEKMYELSKYLERELKNYGVVNISGNHINFEWVIINKE